MNQEFEQKMKGYFKKHKYLRYTACLVVVIFGMLIFQTDGFFDFFSNAGIVLWQGAVVSFGLYILSMFSGWLFFLITPKYEDFESKKEREDYFKIGNWDLVLFIFLIVVATLTFSGR